MRKKIVIFYPTFAGGGITKNLENILEFLKKKKNICLSLFFSKKKY